ncbi:NAD(P)H-hydrate dehydratase [Anoxynatronum buryatiense]|uniref:Bifunctional NAD(P)H-hydrate repair enzyme n=1 Tax=Anoxynatronum buryatiense TaxID=489973 RepID=A0AA45WSH3_9CLOT|nr:NAD(P)H-hydrate dehydratase [Anoxynatronum buryatiense]SMP37980.1 NAD(P)H-hydrate epimerase [Anoxynatronum buryatiense]
MKILTSQQMKQVDDTAIREYMMPSVLLMERAAMAIAVAGKKMLTFEGLSGVLICCGPGNNGGDGLAAARHFHEMGIPVRILLLAAPETFTHDTLANYHMALKWGLETEFYEDRKDQLEALENWQSGQFLIVDAILGTGLSRQVSGRAYNLIQWINRHPSPVLAVDIPSGIHGDTGKVMAIAVDATKTVSFGLPKVGNVCFPGAEYNGSLSVADIGLPPELLIKAPCVARRLSVADIIDLLPDRPRNAHKGTFGSLLVIAGSTGYTGAAIMAVRGALLSGTGLINIAVKESLNHIFEQTLWEAITTPLKEGEDGGFSAEGIKRMHEQKSRSQAVVAGPGWGSGKGWSEVLEGLLSQADCPMVLDADALNLLVGRLHWLKELKSPVIITPHPGEMARLTGMSIEAVNNNRLKTALEAAKQWGVHVVLKGAGTIIASPDGKAVINSTGNEGMAKAGSGDVLAGIVGSLLAQGMQAFQAAAVACWIHGKAGDVAADVIGKRSITAVDIINALPEVYRRLETREGFNENHAG